MLSFYPGVAPLTAKDEESSDMDELSCMLGGCSERSFSSGSPQQFGQNLSNRRSCLKVAARDVLTVKYALMRQIFLVAVVLSLFSRDALAQKDARDAWRMVINRCAQSDLLNKQLIYFGPSNDVGPGSVWRWAADKSLRLRFELGDAVPEANDRAKIIKAENEAGCRGSGSTAWNLKFGLPFENRLASATLRGDLNRAKAITVTIAGWAVDVLKELPFRLALENAPEPFSTDVRKEGNVIIENALRIRGFQADLEFDHNLGTDLKAKYGSQRLKTSDDGISLGLQWKGDTHLSVMAERDFYLAGAFGRWRDVAGLAEGRRILHVGIPNGARVGSERRQ